MGINTRKLTAQVHLAQGKIAGANVGVQGILARAVFFERAEEAAMGFVERRRFEIAGEDRSIDVAVVRGVTD